GGRHPGQAESGHPDHRCPGGHRRGAGLHCRGGLSRGGGDHAGPQPGPGDPCRQRAAQYRDPGAHRRLCRGT
ncbi:Maff2 family protein, partial [Dysosmobacter welbionis]